MSIVTLPALALSLVVSNFRAPPGSAVSLTVEEAPPPPPLLCVLSLVFPCAPDELLELSELLSSSPPQPAATRAVAASSTTRLTIRFPMAGCTQGPTRRFGSVVKLAAQQGGAVPRLLARVPRDHHDVVVARS